MVSLPYLVVKLEDLVILVLYIFFYHDAAWDTTVACFSF